METKLLTPDAVQEWRIPPFQRPLRINAKVMQIAEELKTKHGGCIEGVISLGTVGDDRKTHYLYDGQHRIEAAKISGLPEFIANVCVDHFDHVNDMALQFVILNSQIAKLRPDDMMRGLEPSNPVIKTIRKHCDFVGYENIRRGTSSPVLSMSATLRCWHASKGEVPTGSGSGMSSMQVVMSMEVDDAEQLCQFLNVARAAWGNDMENARLWANLNLTLCMWLWRVLVKLEREDATSRSVQLTADQFKKCLMSLSASRDYVDWLLGRNMNDRDRSPCYARMKIHFAHWLRLNGHKNPKLPSPAWSK